MNQSVQYRPWPLASGVTATPKELIFGDRILVWFVSPSAVIHDDDASLLFPLGRRTNKARHINRRGRIFFDVCFHIFSLECYRGRALAPSVCALYRSPPSSHEGS